MLNVALGLGADEEGLPDGSVTVVAPGGELGLARLLELGHDVVHLRAPDGAVHLAAEHGGFPEPRPVKIDDPRFD